MHCSTYKVFNSHFTSSQADLLYSPLLVPLLICSERLVITPKLPTTNSFECRCIRLETENASESQSHISTDGRSVRKSWSRALSGAHDQRFITVWQLRPCFCGTPSLTRGRVCLLNMLLVLASAVFLRSESFGTRDHILLSQIWDFHFRCLLRLAGSRWRYSTPQNGPHRKRRPSIVAFHVFGR
jgi:hypothetical protein